LGNSDLSYATGTNNQYTSTALWNISPNRTVPAGGGGANFVLTGDFNITGSGSASVRGVQFQMLDQGNNASAVVGTQYGFDETIGASTHAESGTIGSIIGRQMVINPSGINNTTVAIGQSIIMEWQGMESEQRSQHRKRWTLKFNLAL